MFVNYNLLKICFPLCQIFCFSEVLGLTCSLQVADVIHTGITETNMPHYLRIQTTTMPPLFKSSYLPAKIWLTMSNSSGVAQSSRVTLAAWFTFFTPGFEKCKQSLRSCSGGEGAGATRWDCWICTCIIVCVSHWQLPAPPQILFVASLSQDGGQ